MLVRVHSYLHAENARHQDPEDPEDPEEENFVHSCAIFFAILLHEEVQTRIKCTKLSIM